MKNYINIALSILAATCLITNAATYQGQATGADLDRTHLTLGAGIAEAGKVLTVNNDINVSNINKLAAIELGVPNITLVSTSTAIRLSTTATILWGNDTSPNAVLGQSSGDSIYLRHVPTPGANAVTNSIVLANSALNAVMSNTNLLSITPTRVALGAWNPVTASNAYLGGVLSTNWSNAIVPFISISATNLTLGNRFTSIANSNGMDWSYLSSGLTLGPKVFSPSTAFTGNASAALILSNGNLQIIGKGFSSAGVEGLRGYPNNVIIGAGENGSGWYSAGSNSMPFIRFVRSITNSAYPDGQPRSMAIYPSPYSNWLCIVPGTIANGSTLIGGDPGTVILDTSNAKYFNVATNYFFGAGITGNFDIAEGKLSMYGESFTTRLESNIWQTADSTTNYALRANDGIFPVYGYGQSGGGYDGSSYVNNFGQRIDFRTTNSARDVFNIYAVDTNQIPNNRGGMTIWAYGLAHTSSYTAGSRSPYFALGLHSVTSANQSVLFFTNARGTNDTQHDTEIWNGAMEGGSKKVVTISAEGHMIIHSGSVTAAEGFIGNGVNITNMNFGVNSLGKFLGIYTNISPNTTVGVTNGAYFLDSGSNTVNFSINGTWKYINLNSF